MTVDRVSHVQVVRSYELDPYRHLNNGAYINWFEDAREHFLRAGERHYNYYPDHAKAWFVVVNIDCDFKSAALSGERVLVTTRLCRTGRSSVVFRQSVRRADDGRLRARARVVMCFADEHDQSCPIPEDFLAQFTVSAEGDAYGDFEGGADA